MCNCASIYWETSNGADYAVVSAIKKYNDKPVFDFTIDNVDFELKWINGFWYLMELATQNVQYFYQSNDICPISNLANFSPNPSKFLNLIQFGIVAPNNPCNTSCSFEMFIKKNGVDIPVAVTTNGTKNQFSTFQFLLDGTWTFVHVGSDWELYFNGIFVSNIMSMDNLPIGFYGSYGAHYNSIEARTKSCSNKECGCGITMRFLSGEPITQFAENGTFNGRPLFQGIISGQIFQVYWDSTDLCWYLVEGDVNVGFVTRWNKYIGANPCPFGDKYDWENMSGFYNVNLSAEIECREIILQDRIYKKFDAVKLPIPIVDQQRGETNCCCEYIVLAGNGTESWKNDMTSAWIKLSTASDTIQFVLKQNGIPTSYAPQPQSFLNEPNAWFTTIQWSDVLISDGEGCYELSILYNISGIVGSIIWGVYKLKTYTIANALKTARIRVKFNGKQIVDGIDFTGSNVESSIRFNGFIGNRQPNTEIDNIIYSDRQMKRVIRENLNQYEITTDPVGECIINPIIDLFLLSENEMFISDYNAHNFSYNYLDKPVIVFESAKIEYKQLSRLAVLTCIVSDKIQNERTFFNEN
jgi:hypothetical protein